MPDFVKSYKVGKDIYNIPESESASFLQTAPDAQEIKSFKVGNDEYDIPELEVDAFKTASPDAKPSQNYNFEPVVAPEPVAQAGVNIPVKSEQEAEPTKEATGFWSTWMGDAMQGFSSGAATFAGGIAGITNLPMRSYMNYKAKEGGLSDEERKVFVDGFIQSFPTSAAGEQIKISAKKQAERLSKASDRYEGKDFQELYKDGDYGAVAGDIFLQGSKSLFPSIIAMATGGAGLGLIGLSSMSDKYDQLDNPELPQIFTQKQKDDFIAQKNMGEFQKVTNAALSGTSEAATELISSVPMGKYIGRLIAKNGAPAAQQAIQKGLSAWTNKMFDRYGLLLGPVSEGLEEYVNQIATNTIDYFTGANTVLEPLKDAAKMFVYGMGGGAYSSIGAGAAMAYNKLSGNSGQSPVLAPGQSPINGTPPLPGQSGPVSPDNTPVPVLDPRSQAEQNLRDFHATHADKDSGMLHEIGQITPDGEETKIWYITNEGDGGEGNQFYLVEDDKGGYESLTKEEVTGKVKEVNVDDYVATGMTRFDRQQAGQTEREQNKMTIDGKVLTRMPNEEGKYEGGEFWLDENNQSQEVSAEEISAWEKSKQGNPNSNPNIVNRTFGKIQVTGVKDESGNIVLSEPMVKNQAEELKLEVERTTGGKATIQTAAIPSEDVTMEDSYNVSIVPVAVSQVIDPEIKAQVEAKTKPSYTYKGNPTAKGIAEAVVRNAILTKNQAKLSGLVINNDPELSAAIEKAFPKPKAKFTIGKSKVTVQDALDHILISDDLAELEQLKHENIEAEPNVKAAYELKLQEFTPIQNETLQAEVNAPAREPIVDNSISTNGIADNQDGSSDVSRDIPELKSEEVNPQVDLEPIQETKGSSTEQIVPDALTPTLTPDKVKGKGTDALHAKIIDYQNRLSKQRGTPISNMDALSYAMQSKHISIDEYAQISINSGNVYFDILSQYLEFDPKESSQKRYEEFGQYTDGVDAYFKTGKPQPQLSFTETIERYFPYYKGKLNDISNVFEKWEDRGLNKEGAALKNEYDYNLGLLNKLNTEHSTVINQNINTKQKQSRFVETKTFEGLNDADEKVQFQVKTLADGTQHVFTYTNNTINGDSRWVDIGVSYSKEVPVKTVLSGLIYSDLKEITPVINQNVKPFPEKQNTLQGNEGDGEQNVKPKLKTLSDYKKGDEWRFTTTLKDDYEKTKDTDTYNLWRNDIKLDEAIEQSGKGNFVPLMNIENAYIQRKFDKEQKLKADKAIDIASKSNLKTPTNGQPDKPREATPADNNNQQGGGQGPVDNSIGVENEGEGNQGEGIQSKVDNAGLILTELNGKFYIKTTNNQMLGHGKTLEEAYNKAKDMYPQAFVSESKGQAEGIAKEQENIDKNMQSVYVAGINIFGLSKDKSLALSVIFDRIIGQMALRKNTTKESIYLGIDFRKSQLDDLLLKKNVLMQVASDIDIFKSDNISEAKEYIDSVYGAVENNKEATIVFRKLASTYHPDRNTSETATAIMQYLNNVNDNYETGSKATNPINKGARPKYYDKEFDDIINDVFGKTQRSKSTDNAIFDKNKAEKLRKNFNENQSIAQQLGIWIIKNIGVFSKRIQSEYNEEINRINIAYEKEVKIAKDWYIHQSAASVNRDGYNISMGKELINREKSISEAKQKKSDNLLLTKITFEELTGKQVLFQGAKGAVQFLDDSNIIIHALIDPDISTPLHEIAHVYEQFLTENERKIVLEWAGSEIWNKDTSENFARGFEKYLYEGKAPSSDLQHVFNRLKKWLNDIYSSVKLLVPNIKLNNEMRAIYSGMFSKENNDNQKQSPEPSSKPLSKQPKGLSKPIEVVSEVKAGNSKVLSEADYIKNGIAIHVKQNHLDRQEFEDSEEYAPKFNELSDEYPAYVQSLSDSGDLQKIFDGATLGEKIAIRKDIQTANLNVDDLIDLSKEKKDSKTKNDAVRKEKAAKLHEMIGITTPEVESERVPEVKETIAAPKYGDKQAEYDKLRAQMRAELGNLNSGPNPKILEIGIKMGLIKVEFGTKKFVSFAKEMIEDIGEAIKPFLKIIYNGVRDYPGMEQHEAEMDDYNTVKAMDIEKVLNNTENIPDQKNNPDKSVVPSDNESAVKEKADKLINDYFPDTKKQTEEKPVNELKQDDNGKQGLLQGNSKRLSKTAPSEVLQGTEAGRGTGTDTNQPVGEVSKADGEQREPTGRERAVLQGNVDLLEPALVEFNAEENDVNSFNPSKKYDDNIATLETLITLLKENRKATAQEKEILSRYVGFGGLKDVLFNPDIAEGWKPSNIKYKEKVARVVELATEFDKLTGKTNALASIRGSILNAHFTSSTIIKSIYQGLSQLGFKGGAILEPSAGIGNFVTYMPNGIKAKSTINAVELDELTGMVLKHLHDDVNVKITGIQDAGIPNNSQDLVISNVPFGNYRVFDKSFKGDKTEFQNRIHNYFFAKGVDLVREGGIIAFVTSKGVLDSKGNEPLRRYLNENTEFLGAVRLPNNSFKNNANTEVVTDIIFLRKNTTGEKNNTDFVGVSTVEATHRDGEKQAVSVNNYFIEHPENMLGDIVAGGLYSRDDYTVTDKGSKSKNIGTVLRNILPSNVYTKTKSKIGLQANDSQETIDAIKDGNIELSNGQLVKKQDNQLVPISINEPTEKIKEYIKLRNNLMDLIYSEYLGGKDAELDITRRRLNANYDSFVGKYGKLDKSLARIAKQDADGYNVMSLENKGNKADIFTKRTIQPIRNKQNAENIDEAIIISLYENVSLDIERIAELLHVSVAEALIQGKGKMFEQPTGGYVTKDEYLSGNVKAKLKQAQKAVEEGFNDFQYNVQQLQEVIPQDIPTVQIEARLGSRWIPAKTYSDFANYLFNTDNTKITYLKSIDNYSHSGQVNTPEAETTYGTNRRNGVNILIDALLLKPPKIFDNIDGKQVLNPEATLKAVEKYNEIRDKFEDWVYKDEGRRELLGKIYNESFNTSVKRSYNGDHLNIAGINGVELRKHQKDAIWMLLQNNGGIIDHLVGAGKTYVMVAGTMEMKRTGIAKKPMIIALKSTIPQIVESYRSAYPMAKILAPSEKDFTKENRKKLFSQIANNEWDVVIMSHENYGKIPHEVDIQTKFITDEMAEVEAEREELAAKGDKLALKGLETRLKNLQARLEKISDISKDNSLTFQQMGIDHIMVDESQQFKNLSYVTKQRGIAGLSKAEGSKRAFNLYVGIRYLQGKYGADKGTTFLSGTPISNSMVEMYLLLKYLRPTKMAELGFNSFDAWATTFASPSSDIEFTVTGDFKSKTRFREFINVPELSMLYTEIADIRTDENLKLDKPSMKGGGYTVAEIQMSADQAAFAKKLMKFAKTKDGKHIGMTLTENQKTAIMLLATNISSKMAIDMRMINPAYAYDPNGKIATLVKNVTKTFNETTEFKGTQLIFSDLGTPKNKTNKSAMLRDYMEDELGTNLDTLNEIFGDVSEPTHKYPSQDVIIERMGTVLELSEKEIDGILEDSRNSEGSFNVYAEIKQRLINEGIPEDQIVFIHDYNTQKAKEKLFTALNNGDIRIILGSTQKLGTGVNVQERVAAVHHLDVPWTPAAMEQRNGRALRQGNWAAKKYLGGELPVYAYATVRTLDAYKYQLLYTKQHFLNQVKSGSVTDRVIKEADGDSESGVGYAELVAIFSGNADILLKAKLETKFDTLKKAKRNFQADLYQAQSRLKYVEEQIVKEEGYIERTKQSLSYFTEKVKRDESGRILIDSIDGKAVKNEKGKPGLRTDYANKLKSIVDNILESGKNYKDRFIKIGGVEVKALRWTSVVGKTETDFISLSVLNGKGYEYQFKNSVFAGILLNNFEKAIDNVPDILKYEQTDLAKSKKDIISYNEIIKNGQAWPKEAEFESVQAELKEVTTRLETTNESAAEEEEDDEVILGFAQPANRGSVREASYNSEYVSGSVKDALSRIKDGAYTPESMLAFLDKTKKSIEAQLEGDNGDKNRVQIANITEIGKRIQKKFPAETPMFRNIGEAGAANLDKAEEATTRLDNLKVAREMEQSGKDIKSIRLATGWEKGVDGRWRYEVADGEFIEAVNRMIETQHRNDIPETWAISYPRKLSQIIEDKELYKSYPEIADIPVNIDVNSKNTNRGSYSSDPTGLYPENEKILVSAKDFNSAKSVLIHEIQHAIQEIEGFAKGGNEATALGLADNLPLNIVKNITLKTVEKVASSKEYKLSKDQFDRLVDQVMLWENANEKEVGSIANEAGLTEDEIADFFTRDAFEIYRRLAGEVESRNVQSRMNMTPEERRNTLLSETEDVAREDQIILMDGMGVSNLESDNLSDIAQTIINLEGENGVTSILTHKEMIEELSDDLTPENLEILKNNPDFIAVSVNGRVIINKNKQLSIPETVKTWIHENTHLQITKMFPDRAKRKAYFTDLYNEIGKEEIERVLPEAYHKENSDIQAEEYLAYNAEQLSDGSIQGVSDKVKNTIYELVDKFTTLKNIQDATNRTSLRGQTANEDNGIGNKSEVQSDSKANDSGRTDGNPGLRQAKSKDLLEFLKEAKQAKSTPSTIAVNGISRPTTNSKGRPIHPTTEGIKNFWKWFGDSKVVNEKGEPLVVYHGTTKDFDEFNSTKFATAGYFAEDPSFSNHFAEHVVGYKGGDPSILPTYLTLKSPLDITSIKDGYEDLSPKDFISLMPFDSTPEFKSMVYGFYQGTDQPLFSYLGEDRFIALLKEKGFDGILFNETSPESFNQFTTDDKIKSGKAFVAFSPSQVKSATGNNGSFSPDDNDIRFRTRPSNQPLMTVIRNGHAANAARTAANGSKVLRAIGRFRKLVQDAKMSVNVLQTEFGLKVTDYTNLAWAINQKGSKSMGAIEKFDADFVDPIEKAMTAIVEKTKKTVDEISKYTLARHAPERNRSISEDKKVKNQDFDDDNYSGFTTNEATDLFEQFENDVPSDLIANLWDAINKANERRLQLWVDYGKYDRKTVDAIHGKNWKYYVPMAGWEQAQDAIELDYEKGISGGEFAGPKTAKGRSSMADNPIVNMVNMAHSSILWGEKNRVKQTAYRLVKTNPDRADLFSMNQIFTMTDNLGNSIEVVYDKAGMFTDANGKEVQDYTISKYDITNDGDFVKIELGLKSKLEEDYSFSAAMSTEHLKGKSRSKSQQHEVDLFVDGRSYKIIFKDPSISNTINGTDMSKSIPVLSAINRFRSRAVTSWSPVFTIRNTYRDYKTGVKTTFIEDGFVASMKWRYTYLAAAKYMAYNLAKSKAVTADEIRWKQYFDEYNEHGSRTGHAYLQPLDAVKVKLVKNIAQAKRSKLKYINPLSLLKLFESAAAYSESISRFTTYVTKREAGNSIPASTNAAKEITTNFDTKGTVAPLASSFIMFFNPSVQGEFKQLSLAKHHLARYATNFAWSMAQGYIMQMLWASMNGGDDDDDKRDLNDFTKRNNTVIGFANNYVVIPLAQGFRLPNIMGSIVYDLINENISSGTAAAETFDAMMQSFTPVDMNKAVIKDGKISGIKTLGALVSSIQPMTDLAANENFMNSYIYREPFTQAQEGKAADSQLYKDGVNYFIKTMTDWNFKQGGGDPKIKSQMGTDGKEIAYLRDLNPSKIEYFLKAYTGTPGAVLIDGINTIAKATMSDVAQRTKEPDMNIKGVDYRSIPVVGSFVKNKYTGKASSEFWELYKTASELKFTQDGAKKAYGRKTENNISDQDSKFVKDIYLAKEKIDLREDKKARRPEDAARLDAEILSLRKSIIEKYNTKIKI